jgi:hypothetical protein
VVSGRIQEEHVRIAIQAVGCLTAFVVAIIGVFSVIGALDDLLPIGSRVISGCVAVAAIGGSWFIYNRLGREGAEWSAQHSERAGERFGTKVRSYRGASYETVLGLLQRDARSLAPSGYRMTDAVWEPIGFNHPVRYVVLSLLGMLTGTWGEGGTLSVTYEPGSTSDAALSALEAWSGRLRKSAAAEGWEVQDPFADLPFEMTLPPRWEPSELPPDTAPDLVADALFFARDPISTDADYFSTVLVMASEPADDPQAFLARQEADLTAGEVTERTTLPAGEALAARGTEGSKAQVQYFLPTTFAAYAIWFTTPAAELPTREPEFEAIARSFRLK